MIINRAILHIIDFNSDLCVFSQRELCLENVLVKDFIEKHILHLQSDSRGQPGVFLDKSWFFSLLKRYSKSKISFIEFSTEVARSIYETLLNEEKTNLVDLLIVDFSLNNESFVVIMLMSSRLAYTHQVVNNNSDKRDQGKKGKSFLF